MKASPFHTVKWRLLAAALVFLLFAATFDTLRLFLGEGATAFSLIPVIVVTWLFGVTPGLVSAILTILITTLIVCLSDGVSLLLVMQNGGTAGLVTTVMVVFITGYFHGLQKRLKQELVERKKTEETLRQTEKIFQRMFDQSPIGAAIVTLDYRYQHANQAFCQMVGYTEEKRRPDDATHCRGRSRT